ncbi:hypothetical protein PNEG_00926 [Pneumocystis murina B123]|uniref:Protein YIP n=1 Tax=Pneumocystis murina (strain B123) TaxID=1069680 RepID=M7NQ11_PNEMU|nr:hypothetical protein PNEG_00926 [Pneumocystis murina B123]EMR10778.1 hypothetical protein PNEG_00926 [Pneumocystis murina B123]
MSKNFFSSNQTEDLKFYPSNYGHLGKETFLVDKRDANMQSCMQDTSFGVWENKMGWIAAFGTGGYPNEPPLLEELGVNFLHIKGKTLAVLNPLKSVDDHIMDDSDLAGPILFCLLFATFLLLSGKRHFGYIYGVALLGCISLHTIFSLMSFRGLHFSRTVSVLGYCLLPLVLTSACGVLVSMDGLVGYIVSSVAILWCTYSASAMFVVAFQLNEMRFLVAYPVALFYSVFAVMTVFAEKNVYVKS